MKCSRCGRASELELRYSGDFLCGRCFCRLFEGRVRKAVRVGRMLGKRDKVAVGLSGHRDSMTLLLLFRRMFFKAPQSKLLAITVDDGSPGVKAAVEFCRRLGVEHHLEPVKPAGVWKTLQDRALALGVDKIALGVNLEDEVISVLDRMMRGRGGRKATWRGRVGVVKPLRESMGEEIELYAKGNGIRHVRSPGGGDVFRAALKDALDGMECRQPGVKFKLLKSCDRLMEASARRR